MKDAHQPVGDEGSPASTNLGGIHVDSGGGGEHSGTDGRVGDGWKGEKMSIWENCLHLDHLSASPQAGWVKTCEDLPEMWFLVKVFTHQLQECQIPALRKLEVKA